MRVAIVTDSFPPDRTSAAVQVRDLAVELARLGHFVTVLMPSPEISEHCAIEEIDVIRVVRLKSPRTKDIGFVRRALAESILPYAMYTNFLRSPLAKESWDGVVWYSPTIFFGPFISRLKQRSCCRSYLILRDIFPEWAVDIGLLSRGLPYRFFKFIEKRQYSVASVIGVQSHGNLRYFETMRKRVAARVEVLNNWLAEAPIMGASISVSRTPIAGRKIFVYIGNMGAAQGMDILLSLALQMRNRADVGFLFVGRGSRTADMRQYIDDHSLDNVQIFDEIEVAEIPGLFAECHVGMVALDPRHRTHNIPGKFLSYLSNGLPVLANINPGNDQEQLVLSERVGRVNVDDCVDNLHVLAEKILLDIVVDVSIQKRCRDLAKRLFSVQNAATQVVAGLSPS